jgi:hypothetical protein
VFYGAKNYTVRHSNILACSQRAFEKKLAQREIIKTSEVDETFQSRFKTRDDTKVLSPSCATDKSDTETT